MGETLPVDAGALPEGYSYLEPDNGHQADLADKPDFSSLEEEIAWHTGNGMLRIVNKDGDRGWTKDEALDAIEAGFIDAFSKDEFRFPPTSDGEWIVTLTAYDYDDRDFGERLANRVLEGFNRSPRTLADS